MNPIELLSQEVLMFEWLKATDKERLYSKERTYPDKAGCISFDDRDAAFDFLSNYLGRGGYAIFYDMYGALHASRLPDPIAGFPDWMDAESYGYIRLGSYYWQWLSDNIAIWLCPLGHGALLVNSNHYNQGQI
jgi:hypothetical protein